MIDTGIVLERNLKHLVSQIYFRHGQKERAYANEIYFEAMDSLINQITVSDYMKEVIRLGVVSYQETLKEAIPKGHDVFFEHVNVLGMAKTMPRTITKGTIAHLTKDYINSKLHKGGYDQDAIFDEVITSSMRRIECRAIELERQGKTELANSLKKIEKESKQINTS